MKIVIEQITNGFLVMGKDCRYACKRSEEVNIRVLELLDEITIDEAKSRLRHLAEESK